jgi:hypothetical protein
MIDPVTPGCSSSPTFSVVEPRCGAVDPKGFSDSAGGVS